MLPVLVARRNSLMIMLFLSGMASVQAPLRCRKAWAWCSLLRSP